MSQILFRNLSLLDPKWDEPRGGYEVLVEGDLMGHTTHGLALMAQNLAELEAEGAKSDVRRKVRESGEREMAAIRRRAETPA